MALATVSPDTPIESAVYNLHVGAHSGTAGAGQPLVCTDIGSADWTTANSGVDPDTLWSGTFRNQGDLGQALRVLSSDGNTTLLSVADAGVSFGLASGSGTMPGPNLVPGLPFASDTNTGLLRVGVDNWALVTGGSATIEMRKGTRWQQATMGNIGYLWTLGDGVLFHIHHQITATDGGTVVGQAIEVTANAALDGVGIPDSSAITGVIYQNDGAADGAIRAGEFHAFRTVSTAGATNTSTVSAVEASIDSAAAGGTGFGNIAVNSGHNPPKNIGIHVANYATGHVPAHSTVQADVALYVWGSSGWKYGLFHHDTDNTILLYTDADGCIAAGGGGNNAVLPAYGFVGDVGKGIFDGGNDVMSFAAGSTELARMYFLTSTDSAVQIRTGLELFGAITPTQLAANTDNWAPTGYGAATIIRASTDASRNLTGLFAPSGAAPRVICLSNVGAQNLVLVHSATSTATNQFLLPNNANLTLLPNMSVWLWYDPTSTKWRLLGGFVS